MTLPHPSQHSSRALNRPLPGGYGKDRVILLSRVFAACVVALSMSCSNGAYWGPVPLSEHRPSTEVTEAALHLGEGCTAAGYAACLSQVCGHFAAAPESGYFCTRTCAASGDCPRDWTCSQVFPGAENICVSPASWDGGVAILSDGGIE